MSQLFERIRKVRTDNKLSQNDFAVFLNVHRGHISKIETGAAKPSETLLLNICFEFNISWDWLSKGEGLMEMPWGSKELRKLSESGFIPRGQKSFFVLNEFTLALLDSYNKIPQCLGEDIFLFFNDNIKPGDSIVIEIVEGILRKLREKGQKNIEMIGSLSDLNDQEKSVIKILSAFDKNSIKDLYLFLASKGDRLKKQEKEKLEKDIEILKKASI